jgi:hypothetical protein
LSKFIDLTGKRFGRLLVLREWKGISKDSQWVCLCDCGKETTVFGNNIKRGSTKSCGCLHKERFTTHGKSKTPSYKFWHSAQGHAKRDRVIFNITIEDIPSIPEYCPVLGIKLGKTDGKISDSTPSLDKIVPSLGYVKNNLQIISNRANRLKSNMTLEKSEKIYNYIKFNIMKENL